MAGLPGSNKYDFPSRFLKKKLEPRKNGGYVWIILTLEKDNRKYKKW